MTDRAPDLIIHETYYKRLRDAFECPTSFDFQTLKVRYQPFDGINWLFVLIPILIIGAIFIAWMYRKDSRSIRWCFSIPLGLLRATVYGLLAYMFLLPTDKETRIWKPEIPPNIVKQSRVLVLFDVSDSMAKQSDDSSSKSNRQTRLRKLMEFITDDNLAFMRKLLENNPVYVYRFSTKLDKEFASFNFETYKDADGVEQKRVRPFTTQPRKGVKGETEPVFLTAWTDEDWQNFSEYTDFKAWVLRGLSEEGIKAVSADILDKTGNADWAQSYLVDKPEVIVARVKLMNEDDSIRFRGNLEGMKERIAVARLIAQGTNVTESVQTVFESEKDNMVQGIIVFSDGRSNLGVDNRGAGANDDPRNNPALDNLHRAARTAQIPIISIGIGEHREIKLVRITEVQAPDLTPPDDAFKIIGEVDGEHLKGETVDVFLRLTPPDSKEPLVLPGKVTFDQGDPPHGQYEWTINPPDIVKLLDESALKTAVSAKELPEGEWKAQVYTAKVDEDGKPDPKQKVESEERKIIVKKKSVRILLVASVANRDFQYLLTQLIRDKADVSIVLQNDAGQFLNNMSISYLDDKYRHLSKFPDRLKVEDDPSEKPETMWLNLARYDVIIAFDPDWTLLTREQAELIRTWVDLQVGGLLHVAGSINTKKLTSNEENEEVKKRLEPLLDILPVILKDNNLGKPEQIRNVPRRLDFTGATPDMEFLRLDDDKPGKADKADNLLSGWEGYFTGNETREKGMTAELKRGFFDYYPIRDVKAGAAIVARYMEPRASENTFDKKDPAYIVTYKYGQGTTVFMGSSEIWRFNTYKDVYRERFWVKMSRYLAAGSRRKQNNRGRILMAKEFVTGERLRFTVQILDANLKGLPTSARPKCILRPIELDPATNAAVAKSDEQPKTKDVDPLFKWTNVIEQNKAEAKANKDGYFQYRRLLKAQELDGRDHMEQVEEDRHQQEGVRALFKGQAQEFPPGKWQLEVDIPNSSEKLTQKFFIRKTPPPELVDVRPDMVSLAAISSEVDEPELKIRLTKKPDVHNKLRERAYSTPSLDGKRLAFHISDRESIQLIPEIMSKRTQEIENPQTEPEIRLIKIEPLWFNGPNMPAWMSSWYDRMAGQSQQSHTVALWMLVVIALLSVEWLTRKLLKLA